MEITRFQALGISCKNAQGLRRYEKPAGGQPLLQSADTKRCKQRSTGQGILRHENFERLRYAMNGLRRRQAKSIGEFPVSDRLAGPGLLDENHSQAVL
ncbi:MULTISPECIES: hypothetical protein [Mesorhizobium]|uniref:hypothetical protein n=1 Tax=Mesorhizobium TaxID=68287 RepID=UPI001314F38B|nr:MULTISPECIES: hypothetical protein [Mesorhizobium]